MDQLKVFLNEAVKHRFWIAIGLSGLLPLIAWFASSGALGEETKAGETKAKSAYDGVKEFVSGSIKNGQWTQKVQEKTKAVEKDVNSSWRKLYARQAPLLSWPERVEPTFLNWGRNYPEGVDPQRIREIVLEYTQDYPAYVDKVYSSFKPFNYEDGTGIVAAPPKEDLLQPQVYRESSPPGLGEVWSAQEKLWIERTLFDVIAKVNERAGAKDWDGAVVKQIVAMDIASPLALDQKNAANAEGMLEDAPDILPPGASEADTEASDSGERGFGTGGGAGAASTKLQYVISPNPDQYFIVPIALDVMVEQDHISDLLVEFSNSPMSIQVLDFEFLRPVTPVEKPRKGEVQPTNGGGDYSGMGGGGYAGGSSGSSSMSAGGMGGKMSGYNPNMGGGGGSMAAGNRTGGMKGGGGRGAMGAEDAPKGREGENVLEKNAAKFLARNKKSKKDEETKDDEEAVVTNPYINVVEVRIKGQARFYKTPPPAPEQPVPTSPQAEPAPPAAEVQPAKADEPKANEPKADEPKADNEAPKAPDDTPKA